MQSCRSCGYSYLSGTFHICNNGGYGYVHPCSGIYVQPGISQIEKKLDKVIELLEKSSKKK